MCVRVTKNVQGGSADYSKGGVESIPVSSDS